MTIALFGCGAMGQAAALAMIEDPQLPDLLLVDVSPDRIATTVDFLRRHHPDRPIATACIDINDERSLAKLLSKIEIVAASLPWPATESLALGCLQHQRPMISITRPNYATLKELADGAQKARGTILLGCGLEPGLAEIVGRHTATKFGAVRRLDIRCGGIPIHPEPPLNYALLFGTQLPLTPREAFFVSGGRLVATRRFEGLETIHIPGLGFLEAFHDGLLPSFHADEALCDIPDISQKTLRWPGFAAAAQLLSKLGFLSDQPVLVDGVAMSPRAATNAVLRPLVTTAPSSDTCVLLVRAEGVDTANRAAIATCLIQDMHDSATGLTAMARMTGFTLAAIVGLFFAGKVEGTGLLLPHQAIREAAVEALLARLRERGVRIHHDVSTGQDRHLLPNTSLAPSQSQGMR